MSRTKDLLEKRNKAIYESYIKLSQVKDEDGEVLYRHVAVLSMISRKFYLSKRTIEEIVNGNNVKKKPETKSNQLSLIDQIKDAESEQFKKIKE